MKPQHGKDENKASLEDSFKQKEYLTMTSRTEMMKKKRKALSATRKKFEFQPFQEEIVVEKKREASIMWRPPSTSP